jgi:transposase
VEVVHPRCAGIDVSKRDAKVCIRIQGSNGRKTSSTVTTWGSMTNQILALRDHLAAQQVTVVIMESTSDYWRPFYYVLEADFDVLLVNAREVKNVPGRKTDLLTELPDRIPPASPKLPVRVARLRGHDQRRGCAAGIVAVGGAAVRVA